MFCKESVGRNKKVHWHQRVSLKTTITKRAESGKLVLRVDGAVDYDAKPAGNENRTRCDTAADMEGASCQKGNAQRFGRPAAQSEKKAGASMLSARRPGLFLNLARGAV